MSEYSMSGYDDWHAPEDEYDSLRRSIKIMVEVSDDQVCEVIRQSVIACVSQSMPRAAPMAEHHAQDLVDALDYAHAANVVMTYFGAPEVDVAALVAGKQLK